eukprot:gene41771-43075_t
MSKVEGGLIASQERMETIGVQRHVEIEERISTLRAEIHRAIDVQQSKTMHDELEERIRAQLGTEVRTAVRRMDRLVSEAREDVMSEMGGLIASQVRTEVQRMRTIGEQREVEMEQRISTLAEQQQQAGVSPAEVRRLLSEVEQRQTRIVDDLASEMGAMVGSAKGHRAETVDTVQRMQAELRAHKAETGRLRSGQEEMRAHKAETVRLVSEVRDEVMSEMRGFIASQVRTEVQRMETEGGGQRENNEMERRIRTQLQEMRAEMQRLVEQARGQKAETDRLVSEVRDDVMSEMGGFVTSQVRAEVQRMQKDGGGQWGKDPLRR